MSKHRLTTLGGFVVTVIMLMMTTGCQSEYNGNGILFSCDGSGSGVIFEWGSTARQGMRDAGFKGVMEQHRWQTGAGAAVDHVTPPMYKRVPAKLLADRIAMHHQEHPDDPIYLSGLSAGCAVILYALEELPDDVKVEQVVLLSSSVSADYDLRVALRHVRGRIYAFTSKRDEVLKNLVSLVGTADGKLPGTPISGLNGFRNTQGGRVQNIAWRPEFRRYGHNGGHTEVVSAPFVKKYVAPLFVPAKTRR